MKNKISRRQFLQVSGASAAALLLAACSGNAAVSSGSVSSSSAAASSAASSDAAASSETASAGSGLGKTLVVYYSASGHTKRVAEAIADRLNADAFEITPVQPYTSDDLNWSNNDSRVSREHNNESLRNVELTTTTVPDWDSYDSVLIGYPIWWGIAAWPVNGFVAANDFSGKNIVPFCTSASSGIGQSGTLLEELTGTGTWLDGYRFSSSASAEDVAALAERLNL